MLLLRKSGGNHIAGVTMLDKASAALRSCHPDGSEDHSALHAAEKVTRGKKYIATRWLTALEE